MAPDPVEALLFLVVVFIVLDDPVLIILLHPPVQAVLLVVVGGDLLTGHGILVLQLPGIEVSRGVIVVLDHAAALQHEHLIAFLTQFHCCVAATDAGADDDGVVGDRLGPLGIKLHEIRI